MKKLLRARIGERVHLWSDSRHLEIGHVTVNTSRKCEIRLGHGFFFRMGKGEFDFTQNSKVKPLEITLV